MIASSKRGRHIPIPPSDDEADAPSAPLVYCGPHEGDPDIDDINEDYESAKDGPIIVYEHQKMVDTLHGMRGDDVEDGEDGTALSMEAASSTAVSESPTADDAELNPPIPAVVEPALQPILEPDLLEPMVSC
jgi:hypothetical protein